VIRHLPALIAIAALVAVTVFFADEPGAVSVVWLGWRIDMPAALLLLALAVIVFLLWLLYWALTRLLGAPGRMARARRDQQRLQGYRVLTDGLVALAAGDGKSADKARQRAELLFRRGRLDLPPLARLLAAQSALLRGDDAAAKAEFNAMLASPDTEFLGLRGLIVQALRDGDDATALALTERAKRLKPGAAWVLQSQLALEARGNEWRRAAATLKEAVKRGAVTPEQGRHYKATLLVAHSRQAATQGYARDALSYAAQANGLEPGFAPAAIHYARLLRDGGKVKKGLDVLEQAWREEAHPAVADAYGLLLATEAPAARVKRFERLAELRPGEAEGQLGAAAVAISARLWGEARRHLELAGANGPGPWPNRLCLMMAELEQADRNDATAAHFWLDRAHQAAEEPIWVCTACAAECGLWEPLCPTCHGFDTLAWRVPDRSAARPLDPAHGLPPGAPAAVAELAPDPAAVARPAPG
jgi:HemY protein